MTRILFNCDDFGKTHQINAAILHAHREGVLGSASLMVAGDAFDEAVEIARANPSLKVGLHLALCDAKPLLSGTQVPDLTGKDGHFLSPSAAGIRMAFCPKARAQAVKEIGAQFDRFIATGLSRSHVDGHHHLHMHPFVFRESVDWARKMGFARIRIVREFGNPLPPRRDLRGFAKKLIQHIIFAGLATACNRMLVGSSLQWLAGVLGLWESGRISEDYLLGAIPRLPDGDWEIYVHIGSEGSEEELPAMLSSSLKHLLQERDIAVL